MSRASLDLSDFQALNLEGALISPAILARIARSEASEQSDEQYSLPPGLTLREELPRFFRIGQALFQRFAAADSPGAGATKRLVVDLLEQVFGFDDFDPGGSMLVAGDGRVPIVITPPSDALDRPSDLLSIERRHSAASLLQETLNREDAGLWGLACNGHMLRLMRTNNSLTRPAWIEANLVEIFGNEDFASFSALWLLIHRSRFGRSGTPQDSALERWRDTGTREGEAARDRLRDGVEEALRVLGSGFLDANPELRARLAAGDLGLDSFFNELLRLVYRLIFLMVAEDRDLLHQPGASRTARDLYRAGYSLTELRRCARRRSSWDRHHDRWEGLKITFRALATGQPRLGLPALGGLFAPEMLASLRDTRLPNRALMEGIYRLSWLAHDGALVRINWRAMETEELGSVYESLLELTPRLSEDARQLIFADDASETRGNQRKTTGSYYTPDSLVEALLDSALDPVLERVEAGAEDPAEALLKLTVIDPACGSGHFLLAAGRRIADRVAYHRGGGTPGAGDYRQALRDVARSCLHGVDRNPMAVELAKVALWIETVEPGKPLGFLDTAIRCGDALLGVHDLQVLEDGIPDDAYKALSGDDRPAARYYRDKNRRERAERDHIASGFGLHRHRDFMRDFAELRDMPEDTEAEVAAKAKRFRALMKEGKGAWDLKIACDLYTAAFLLPKRKGGHYAGPDGLPRRGAEMVPTSGTVWESLRGKSPFGPMFGAAMDAAGAAGAFHWPLEFPNIMARGGFDVVLGNPPWERIKLQEQEFFASRDPEIAKARNAAARRRLIGELKEAEAGTPRRELFDAFERAKRDSEALSTFVRLNADQGGRFPLTGRGDVNTYALFAELFSMLPAERGRAGMIVPTGIATDATTAPFFAALIEGRRIARLIDFENRERIFPAIDSRIKFSLLTLGRDEPMAEFAFFLTDPLQRSDPERNFELTPETIAAINPNTRTAPVFRARADAELTAKIYSRVPVLVDEARGEDGNPWGVSFARLFDMSNDSHLFRTAAELAEVGMVREGADWVMPEGIRPCQKALELAGGGEVGALALEGGGPREPRRYKPLYEAKMIHQFDHRWASYDEDGSTSRDLTEDEKADPHFEPAPRYWVPEAEVDARLASRDWSRGWLMGWRDITNATNERTTIATVFPRYAIGNNLPLMLFHKDRSPGELACLIASLSSLALDFFARHKVGGTHLNFFIYQQLPVLPPSTYTSDRLAFITPRVLELTYTSHSMAPFARDLGYDGPPFAWDEERRAHLRAELDAFYARAYGLDRDELRYVLDPAEIRGEDYPSETFRVLKSNEMRKFDEYRTARLTLAAWDRMESEGEFARLGL